MRSPKVDIVFGDCAGVFHPASGKTGVVICSSHGYEDLCSHQPLRLFAEQLVNAGLPTLRFDYPGTGNSLGSDEDVNGLERWIASIEEAVAWLLANAGVHQVVLVGLRLGGLLAMLAAAKMPHITTLVLIAPVQSGRIYLREMKLQSRLYPVSNDPSQNFTGEGVSSIGFVISDETAASLRALKAADIVLSTVRQILVMADGVDVESSFARHLAESGSNVQCLPFADLQSVISDPILSLSANQPFTPALEFLVGLADASPSNKPARILERKNCFTTASFIEEAQRFGDQQRLFGTLCRSTSLNTKSPAIIFINTGASRNIGWARSTVHYARAMAEQGYNSLRMDLSGLGESEAVEGQPVILYNDAFCADIRAALNHVESLGYRSCVLIGSCSGAQAAFNSMPDARVRGLMLINLLRFNIPLSEASVIGGAQSFRSTANYLRVFSEPGAFDKLLKGGTRKIGGIAKEYARRASIMLASVFGNMAFQLSGSLRFAHPVHRKFVELAQDNVQMLIVYGDNDNGLDELAIHLGAKAKMLRRFPQAELAIIDNADHNMTAKTSQNKIQKLISSLLTRIQN